jgi:ankyrin repeat protein
MNHLLLAGLTLISCLAHGAASTAEDGNRKLCLYASKGNLEQIESLIAEGVDLNTEHFRLRQTPLNLAIFSGHTAVVKALLKAGADCNHPGYIPLHVASGKGCVDIVAILLAAGADIDAQDIFGKPALWLASELGHTAVVNMLLAQKQQQLEAMPAYEWQTAKPERNEIKGASLAVPSAKRQP